MGMKASLVKDIHLLAIIRKNQIKMKGALEFFECNTAQQLTGHEYALDLSAMYTAQIGEASKNLTDESRQKLTCLRPDMMRYYRNMIDHVYEEVDKKMLGPMYLIQSAARQFQR